jgi:selenide,water dikinase
MAQGSNVTVTVDLAILPLFPGVEQIDVTKFRTRASKTNREYTEGDTRFEGTPDPTRLEFFYDAQTSGGLLISVPAVRSDELVGRLKEARTPAAAIVGEVAAFGGKHLVVK